MLVAIGQCSTNRASSLYSSLTIHALQSSRVVLSDSERELDDASDDFTSDANITKRSSSHLSSDREAGIGDPSDSSKNNDLQTASVKSNNNTPGADTLNQISGSKAVKRKADGEGNDPRMITTSLRASIGSDASVNSKERPRKSQRLRSGHGLRSAVDYNMKHHPMDDFLRPRYSAKRRANEKQFSEVSTHSDEEIADDNENGVSGKQEISPNPHRRRSSRNIHPRDQPIYSAKWHPLDQMLKDSASSGKPVEGCILSKTTRKSSRAPYTLDAEGGSMTFTSDDAGPDRDAAKVSDSGERIMPNSPGQRRSARISSFKDGPRNYDMKYGGIIQSRFTLRLTPFPRYHVMDAVLRPIAAAKRMESRLLAAISSKITVQSAASDRAQSQKPTISSPNPSTRRSVHRKSDLEGVHFSVTPARPQLQNPYLNQNSITWNNVQALDRRIYLLQKGAPLNSNTFSQDWINETFNNFLSDEGIITSDELSNRDNIEILKNRYESVRLGLQNFFDSEPEPENKNCWTLSKTEGFDVYKMESGSRYWRHQEESIVKGITISTSSNIVGSATAPAKKIIANRNRELTDGIRGTLVQNGAITLTSMRDIMKEGDRPRSPYLEVQRILGFDSERAVNFDHEDDSERGAITETENSLIESMRGGHFSSSVMSDTALEELLLPAEQDLKEEPDHEIVADLVLSDLKDSEPAGRVLAYPDKALDKISYGLAETVQMNNEETSSGDHVCPQGTSDEPRAPKKAKKRKLREDFAVIVHEDPPGRTPLIEKVVRMNPVSPGTDIPKENLEGDGSVGDLSQVDTGILHTRRPHRVTATSSTRSDQVATTATPRYRSPSSSPTSSSTVR